MSHCGHGSGSKWLKIVLSVRSKIPISNSSYSTGNNLFCCCAWDKNNQQDCFFPAAREKNEARDRLKWKMEEKQSSWQTQASDRHEWIFCVSYFFLKVGFKSSKVATKARESKKVHYSSSSRNSHNVDTDVDVRRCATLPTKRRRCQRRRRRRRRRRCQDARAVITNFRRQQKRRYFWQKTKLIKSRLVW